jgi:poly(3-hydroxybutyrate) depolymerase
MSKGCGSAPVGANSGGYTDHIINIPVCPGTCVADGGAPAAGTPSYPDCIDPCFAPGGPSYKANAGESALKRDYTIELPANYNPGTAYPLFMGGGGCGGNPPQNGNGFGVDATNAITIGLQYVNGCFADGGSACSGADNLEPLCVRGPELPYIRAILAEVEAGFCVDLGNEFIGGYSSGGWEAFTSGCGAANLLRGFVSEEGGWRVHQPACTGPIAALMVAGEADTVNPIGPLATINTDLDSFGSAPGRDEVLMRNGCVGTATTMYDPNYPACVKYTGCPAAYPVVWCPLPGAGHNDSSVGNLNYSPGSFKGDPLMWKFLSTLPPAP